MSGVFVFFFQAEDGIRDRSPSRGLGDVYKRQEHYGKIYLTDRGIFVAKAVRAQLETVLTHFPPVRIDMTEEERYNAALALTSALPERAFTGEYDRLFGPDESEKENAS